MSEPNAKPTSECRILIAEDSEVDLKVLTAYLNELGVKEVIAALNGDSAYKRALQLINENQIPDLILSDMKMPGGSGLEFLKKIRAHSFLRETPFLMLTGVSEESQVKDAAALRVDGYILKPIEKESFKKKIAELLAKKSSQNVA